MKKSIKQKPETDTSINNKKDARTSATQQKGYKEEVFDDEEQKDYNKSNEAKDGEKNTSGPEA